MKRLTISFIVAITALCGCGTPDAQLTELTTSDREAIAAARAALVEAILAGDAATYASLCTEDVQLLHPDAPIITGRAELEAHNAAIFDVISVTRLVLTPVEIYGVGHLAYEVGTQEVAIEPSDDRFRGRRKYVHVLKREADGEWRFAVLMSNNTE